MIIYKINPDYVDLWGEDAGAELTTDEIEMIAHGWETTVEDIIDQLEPVNYKAAVELMDDDIRESLHNGPVSYTDAHFLWEYCKRHLEKFGEPFNI